MLLRLRNLEVKRLQCRLPKVSFDFLKAPMTHPPPQHLQPPYHQQMHHAMPPPHMMHHHYHPPQPLLSVDPNPPPQQHLHGHYQSAAQSVSALASDWQLTLLEMAELGVI